MGLCVLCGSSFSQLIAKSSPWSSVFSVVQALPNSSLSLLCGSLYPLWFKFSQLIAKSSLSSSVFSVVQALPNSALWLRTTPALHLLNTAIHAIEDYLPHLVLQFELMLQRRSRVLHERQVRPHLVQNDSYPLQIGLHGCYWPGLHL